MANMKLKVNGMHCQSCELIIKEDLEDVIGINKATPSRKTGTVTIEFDEKTINKKDIIKFIEMGGYKIDN